MRAMWRRVLAGAVIGIFLPGLAWAQTAPEVGVVTTIEGQATVAHLAGTSALPLKFRDSIFERDQINTGEKSTVRVLMGGKAVVTVRELSVLTITEELGKTTVDLSSGKIAVAVARQRMKPGETLEVHTPNAVAAVRGTVFVVEVEPQAGAQGGTNTQVTTVHGSVAVGLLGSLASSALVNTFQQVDVSGTKLGHVGDLTQHDVDRVLAGFGGVAPRSFNRDTVAVLVAKEQKKMVATAASTVPLQNTPPQQQNLTPGGCGGAPCLNRVPTPPPPPPPPPPRNPAIRP